MSQGARGAAAWIRSIPATHRTTIPSVALRVAMQWWLHLPLPHLAGAPPSCFCWRKGVPTGSPPCHADRRGDHDLCCKNSPTLYRHNEVLRAFAAACRLVGLATSTTKVLAAMQGILNGGTAASASKQQPDLLIDDFHGHWASTLADLTISHPTATSNMKTLYRCVGAVAAQRERAKEAKHGAKARAVGHRFFPCGFESYGAWGPSSVKLLGLVTAHAESVHAENTTGVTGWSAPHIAEVARQWVSVALVRSTARTLLPGEKYIYSGYSRTRQGGGVHALKLGEIRPASRARAGSRGSFSL